MSVGQTGLISQVKGRLIEEDVVERLVRIEIGTRGNKDSDSETCGDDGEREGIEMREKPVVEEVRCGIGSRPKCRARRLGAHFPPLAHGAGVHLPAIAFSAGSSPALAISEITGNRRCRQGAATITNW